MIIATLIRDLATEQYTQGTLTLPGLGFSCFTLERPWLNNQTNISCIPAGLYDLQIRMSPRFGRVYWVLSVQNRSYILIHSGNLVKHTHGCILLGRKRGYLHGERAVLVSRPALRQFMRHVEGQDSKLLIIGDQNVT